MDLMDFTDLPEPFIHEYEQDERYEEPEDMRHRQAEDIREKRKRYRGERLFRKQRHEHAHHHAHHEQTHHEEAPENIVGSVRYMEIEQVFVDSGEEHEQHEEENRFRIRGRRDIIDRHRFRECERDIDVDEDVDELVAPEYEAGRDSDAGEQKYERKDAGDVLGKPDARE